MKYKFFYIVIVMGIFTLLFISSCEKADELELAKEKLLGTWAQIEPQCSWDCDTLIFNANDTLNSKVYVFNNAKYDLIAMDTLQIRNNTYYIELRENDTQLMIEDFWRPDSGVDFKDMILKKINE